MPVFHNNVAKDTIDERIDRLIGLSANIGAQGAELGLSPEEIAAAEASYDEWLEATTHYEITKGAELVCRAEANERFGKLRTLYIKTKVFMTKGLDPNDELQQAYWRECGFDGQTPRTAAGILPKIETLNVAQQRFIANGTPFLVKPERMAALLAAESALTAQVHAISAAITACAEAKESAKETFDRHSRMLRRIFAEAEDRFGKGTLKLKTLGGAYTVGNDTTRK